jgi:hypothetical protein
MMDFLQNLQEDLNKTTKKIDIAHYPGLTLKKKHYKNMPKHKLFSEKEYCD